MMSKYILNIKSQKIHNGDNPCASCRNAKKSNLKQFDSYADAVNYFDSETVKGIPCGKCMKLYDK